MGLDEELESMEEVGETDAEWTDQETELEDAEDDEDAIFDADGEDAAESDLEHAYDSFMTDNEADYDGWDPDEVPEAIQAEEDADILHSEGYHIEEEPEDAYDTRLFEQEPEEESEVIEMEIEEGDIYAMIVDEHDNEIGFILLDEDGNEQEYYYVDEDNDGDGVRVERTSDGDEFDLGISREGVAAATRDMNAIYKDGVQVAAELKSTFDEISDSLSFLKKKK